MTPADLIEQLDADRSTVYRWVDKHNPKMPQPDWQEKLAALFEVDPDALLRHPDDDWLSRFFRDKTEEQKEKAIQMLKLLFEDSKTGTDG